MSDSTDSRISRIESDVQHIKGDVADLRAEHRVELRQMNDRIDATNRRIDDLRDSVMTKLDDVYKDLLGRIDGVKDKLSDKLNSLTVWALVLYFTLAGGLLTVIARAFKWI